LCYLQQAIEITADADKKKRIDSAKPVAFRAVRQIVPANNKEKAETVKKIAETQKPAGRQEPPQTPKPPTSAPQSSNSTQPAPGKLTGLAGIRKQFKGNPLNTGVVADQPLEMQKLQEAWAGYVEQLRAARNPAAQPFELARLHIEDANSFQVFTSNNIEQKFIEQERNKLFEFLQQQLQNRMLQFVVLVEENQTPREAADIPLSSKEQYQQLVTQYPLIKTLRDRLQMDLDY
jgi:DNA polymerase-3 subunit gamma/tau